MFKKLYEAIDEISGKMNGLFSKMDVIHGMYDNCYSGIRSINNSTNHIPKVECMQKTIDSQQRTIEQLTNALKDKYEHGLFVFSEDGKIPMVIRNGKMITNELTSYFGIDWSVGTYPTINIEQHAGTYYDMEV